MKKRLKEINARRAEIRNLINGEDDVDLDALNRELDELDVEEATINKRMETADRLNRGAVQGDEPPNAPNPITGQSDGGENRATPAFIDSRAARLADLQGISETEATERATAFADNHTMQIRTDAVKRALTLTSTGQIAQPSRVSGINPMQNQVSGIIDMVHVVDADGMGEDAVAYQKTGMTAASKKDTGAATTDSTPEFAIAKITPTLITTLAYISKNIQRTTPLNYQNRVSDSALAALRKNVSRMIVTGNPAATIPEMTGILKAAAIEDGTDITISKIDETTLRKIALSYGGDDNIEGGGVLLLNKEDLIAFGDIRGTNEKKAVYEIEFSENSTTVGTIKDGGLAVTFCINNALPALSKAANNAHAMVYGKPLAYQLDLFGPYSVEVSRDYKFAEGLVAVLGEAMVGGNVVTQNGFLRVKKGTAS